MPERVSSNEGLGHTALEHHGPVRLPGDTPVWGEGLLPGWIGAWIRLPSEADFNGLSVQRVVSQKRADCTDEAAYNWFVYAVRCAPVEPPDSPGLRLWIV